MVRRPVHGGELDRFHKAVKGFRARKNIVPKSFLCSSLAICFSPSQRHAYFDALSDLHPRALPVPIVLLEMKWWFALGPSYVYVSKCWGDVL